MTKDLADELERLAKEATPGEWSVFDSGYADDHLGIEATETDVSVVVYGDADLQDDCGVRGRDSAEAEANAALIVALRNALPAILSALRGEQDKPGEGEPVAWRWPTHQGKWVYVETDPSGYTALGVPLYTRPVAWRP